MNLGLQDRALASCCGRCTTPPDVGRAREKQNAIQTYKNKWYVMAELLSITLYLSTHQRIFKYCWTIVGLFHLKKDPRPPVLKKSYLSLCNPQNTILIYWMVLPQSPFSIFRLPRAFLPLFLHLRVSGPHEGVSWPCEHNLQRKCYAVHPRYTTRYPVEHGHCQRCASIRWGSRNNNSASGDTLFGGTYHNLVPSFTRPVFSLSHMHLR